MYSDSILPVSGLFIYHSLWSFFASWSISDGISLGRKSFWQLDIMALWSVYWIHFHSGSCVASGYTSCGGSASVGNCWCNQACYTFRDCCPDIARTCQPRMCLQLYPWCERTCDHFTSFIDTARLVHVNLSCEAIWVDDSQWFPFLSTANGNQYVCYQNTQCTQLTASPYATSAASVSGCCNNTGTTNYIYISQPTVCRTCSG